MPKLNIRDIGELKDDYYPRVEKIRRKKPKKEEVKMQRKDGGRKK